MLPLAGQPVAAAEVAAAVRSQLVLPGGAPGSTAVGEADHRVPAPLVEPITVVVCTRDRPAILGGCLEQLRGLTHGSFEVVVVDNAPANDQTRDCYSRTVGGDPAFRYVREARPGLSAARNRGLAEATTAWVAFTDDDVRVDPWWLDGIAAGIGRDPQAGCVTGLVPPAELDHPAQQYFDRRYSWAARMEPRVYDLTDRRDPSPLYPYSAGLFGTGANFAVDRELLLRLGGFDEALGAGSPARGGEDLDAFLRVLRAGRSLVYEPSAVVWHVHRADDAALRHQLFSYGVGLAAFLTKYVVDVGTAREILVRLPSGLRRTSQMWGADKLGGRAPAQLVAAELLGLAVGPLAYLRGRRGASIRRSAAGATQSRPAVVRPDRMRA
jgi:GT2 family glycosyltransferase